MLCIFCLDSETIVARYEHLFVEVQLPVLMAVSNRPNQMACSSTKRLDEEMKKETDTNDESILFPVDDILTRLLNIWMDTFTYHIDCGWAGNSPVYDAYLDRCK